MGISRLCSLVNRLRGLVALAAVAPLLAAAQPLSALDAQAALQHGALAWDVRAPGASAVGMLPGAVRIDGTALDRWLEAGDMAALAQAVSAAGIDLSRQVVVYGDAGDSRAQALVASLSGVATGAVHWLVGGAPEWQMRGLPLSQDTAARRWPVPQQLVRHGEQPLNPVCAGGLRHVPTTAEPIKARAALAS